MDTGGQAERQIKSGANWFFWIAGMSIVNTVAYRLGLQVTFLIGLASTTFVEGFGVAAADYLHDSATLVLALTLVGEVLITGIFVVLGVLARKGLKWAFIVGLILYALDAVLWLVFGDYLPAAFHLWGLYGIYSGLRALNR